MGELNRCGDMDLKNLKDLQELGAVVCGGCKSPFAYVVREYPHITFCSKKCVDAGKETIVKVANALSDVLPIMSNHYQPMLFPPMSMCGGHRCNFGPFGPNVQYPNEQRRPIDSVGYDSVDAPNSTSAIASDVMTEPAPVQKEEIKTKLVVTDRIYVPKTKPTSQKSDGKDPNPFYFKKSDIEAAPETKKVDSPVEKKEEKIEKSPEKSKKTEEKADISSQYSPSFKEGGSVKISFTWDASKYTICACADADSLDKLHAKVQDYVEKKGKDKKIGKDEEVKKGDLFLADYDGEYYRGMVKSVKDDKVTLTFVDYGDKATVQKTELIRVPSSLEKKPFYGMIVTLDGIELTSELKKKIPESILIADEEFRIDFIGAPSNAKVILWSKNDSNKSLNDMVKEWIKKTAGLDEIIEEERRSEIENIHAFYKEEQCIKKLELNPLLESYIWSPDDDSFSYFKNELRFPTTYGHLDLRVNSCYSINSVSCQIIKFDEARFALNSDIEKYVKKRKRVPDNTEIYQVNQIVLFQMPTNREWNKTRMILMEHKIFSKTRRTTASSSIFNYYEEENICGKWCRGIVLDRVKGWEKDGPPFGAYFIKCIDTAIRVFVLWRCIRRPILPFIYPTCCTAYFGIVLNEIEQYDESVTFKWNHLLPKHTILKVQVITHFEDFTFVTLAKPTELEFEEIWKKKIIKDPKLEKDYSEMYTSCVGEVPEHLHLKMNSEDCFVEHKEDIENKIGKFSGIGLNFRDFMESKEMQNF